MQGVKPPKQLIRKKIIKKNLTNHGIIEGKKQSARIIGDSSLKRGVGKKHRRTESAHQNEKSICNFDQQYSSKCFSNMEKGKAFF
jgi:hypothetical protein